MKPVKTEKACSEEIKTVGQEGGNADWGSGGEQKE